MNLSTDSFPPTGLIYVRGNSVFKGYFKRPDLTAEILDSEGWLKVGDVGLMMPNGSIEVLDRVTDMKKLQHG